MFLCASMEEIAFVGNLTGVDSMILALVDFFFFITAQLFRWGTFVFLPPARGDAVRIMHFPGAAKVSQRCL